MGMGFPTGNQQSGGFNFPPVGGNQQGGDSNMGGGSFDFGKSSGSSFGGGFGHKDQAGSFSEQSSGTGDSSSDAGKAKGKAMSEGYKQLMQKLEGLQQQEEQQKNDLYAKQKARLAAAKSELTAEEDEEKAQETVLKLQSQEREVRSTQIKTEEKLLAMQNGQTTGDSKTGSDAKKSSPFGSQPSNLRSGSFSEGGDNPSSGGGFNF